jgi:hypothetical protein
MVGLPTTTSTRNGSYVKVTATIHTATTSLREKSRLVALSEVLAKSK